MSTIIRLDDELDLDADWRIGESSFRYIANLIAQNHFESMIEFGSGASTVRWAMEFPTLTITAVEHDEHFFAETQDLLARCGVASRVTLIHAALKSIWVNARRFESYAPFDVDGTYDIVIIDGPPATTRRGREMCLYSVYNSLRSGGMIVLDDANRSDEKAIVRNWLDVYPDAFDYTNVPVGHGLAILRKTRHLLHRQFSLRAFFDSYIVVAEQIRCQIGLGQMFRRRFRA